MSKQKNYLEDFYKPEPEYIARFWKGIEDALKHLSNDELYRASFMFHDELQRRQNTESLDSEMEGYLQRSKTIDEFITRCKASGLAALRAVPVEELLTRFSQHKHSVEKSF